MSNDPKLTINSESMKRVDLVEVSGRVDSSNASELDDVLKGIMSNGRHNVVLNLSEVEAPQTRLVDLDVAAAFVEVDRQ